jgi:dienelactone hydrolase
LAVRVVEREVMERRSRCRTFHFGMAELKPLRSGPVPRLISGLRMLVRGRARPGSVAQRSGAASDLRVSSVKRRILVALLAVAAALGAAGALEAHAISRHIQAARLLTHLSEGTGAPAEVAADALTLETPEGPVRANLYHLAGGQPVQTGVVLLHGVHALGIDEPRLQRFSRAFAALGVAVLTPQLDELAAYHVGARPLPVIAAAAKTLRERLPGQPRVGLMGLSFAGGLALIAAGDECCAPDVGWVTAVGAHHDLARVLRFFATNQIERPDGTVQSLAAHDYGPLVIAYAHPEAFFPPGDRENAVEALRSWLGGDFRSAITMLQFLTPASRAKLEALFARQVAPVSADLLAALPRFAETAEAVSPRRFLSRLHVPVLLLHGAGDNVIPATETRWLAQGLPPGAARAVLISEALQHVELHGEPSLGERWALLHFVAELIDQAATAPPSG